MKEKFNNDFEYQFSYVLNSIERIMAQIDKDPLSPTYGCAHLAYWRDKTSDVADMRRQEVMLTLALLYSRHYPASPWKGSKRLKFAVEALLSFWCRNQYSDGSMDEWYKGERTFAATAFSTYAVARTLILMKDVLSENIITLAMKRLKKTANWLVNHNDLFKTNHQAVGVAALAWAGEVLQNNTFKDNAYTKLHSILQVQTKEGWFPEIGHMDIGYTFLTVEYILMAMDLWDDWRYIEPFKRAFDFACEFVHPDLTVGEEYGVCHNPYLSRISVILISRFSNRAAYIRQKLEKESPDSKGISPFLADDLRLLRNSYQPLLAYDYGRKTLPVSMTEVEPIPLCDPNDSIRVYNGADIVRFSFGGGTGIFAPVAGGLLRLFDINSGNLLSDYGYTIGLNSGYATNYTYNRNIKMQKVENEIEIICPISPVKKFMPPFWARVMLRAACSTSAGSKITRKGIDIIRKKKGTAINQSSVNLSSSKSIWILCRRVLFQSGHVLIIDKLIFKKPIKREDIFFLESNNDNWMTLHPIASRLTSIPDRINNLEITKLYSPVNNWHLKELSANI